MLRRRRRISSWPTSTFEPCGPAWFPSQWPLQILAAAKGRANTQIKTAVFALKIPVKIRMTILTSICKSQLSHKIRAISGELELFGSLVKWRSDFVDCDIADCSELVDLVWARWIPWEVGEPSNTSWLHTVHCAHFENTPCTL